MLGSTLALFPATMVQGGLWDSFKSAFVAAEAPESPTIRVLIVHDARSSMVEVKGDYTVYDPYKNEKLSSRSGPRRLPMQSAGGGLKWGEEFPGIFQVKIVPDHKDTRVVVNGIEYKGMLYVYDVGGAISIINEVEIEDYVTSVLSPMFDRPLSKETMNAVAIAARTDAYHLASCSQNPYWHADAEKVGYMGYAVTNRGNGVDNAVEKTRYMVMTQTTPYRGKITTFATSIVSQKFTDKRDNTVSLSVDEVERLAQKGNPADKILSHLFPNTTIGLTHQFAVERREVAELVE